VSRSLQDCRLYGIVDLGYVGADSALGVVREMIAGQVDIIQLRAKKQTPREVQRVASQLKPIISDAGVPFVINDHAEVARDVGADGVHIGQDDGSVADARSIAGAQSLVGKSTHSLGQAQAAAREGADYIGFGPLFATPTKPDYVAIGLNGIRSVHAQVTLPIFCIGGIKLANLKSVIAAGARRVVIVSGLLQAPDIAKYAHACTVLLNQHSEIRNQK